MNYYENGKLVKKMDHDAFNRKSVTWYSENEIKEKKYIYFKNGKISYIYHFNNAGNVSNIYRKDSDGKIIDRSTYYSNGQIKEKRNYYSNRSEVTGWNEDGVKTSYRIYFKDGSKITRSYDKSSQLLNLKSYDKSGKLIQQTNYSYKKGNRAVQTKYIYGKLDQKLIFYPDTGTVKTRYSYNNGKLRTITRYDKNRNTTKVERF